MEKEKRGDHKRGEKEKAREKTLVDISENVNN
jgi:hypothetical protein